MSSKICVIGHSPVNRKDVPVREITLRNTCLPITTYLRARVKVKNTVIGAFFEGFWASWRWNIVVVVVYRSGSLEIAKERVSVIVSILLIMFSNHTSVVSCGHFDVVFVNEPEIRLSRWDLGLNLRLIRGSKASQNWSIIILRSVYGESAEAGVSLTLISVFSRKFALAILECNFAKFDA